MNRITQISGTTQYPSKSASLVPPGKKAKERPSKGRIAQSGAQCKSQLPKIVSLFCGAGGLDLGFKDAGFPIALAIDLAEAAVRTHKRNFPRTHSVVADLTLLQPSGVVARLMAVVPEGERIAVIGGPPCQGFSRANTNSQSDDPRNELPTLYLKIVAELQYYYDVEFIVFENVLGIRDKKHRSTFSALVRGIEKLGFNITEQELCSADFGVPQIRRRVILSGLRLGKGYSPIKLRKRNGRKTVKDAIGGLSAPTFFKRGLHADDFPVHPNHWTMQPKSKRFEDIALTNGNDRSFKRLNWDLPSPTIAFGHREINVHPNGKRRLSIFEAMLIQGFPESFVLEGNLSEQVEQVSNAVPPLLARSIAQAVRRSLKNGRING